MYNEKEIPNQVVVRKTIISFLIFIAFIITTIVVWKTLLGQPKEQQALKPLRAGLNYNEDVFNTFLSNNNLAKTFPLSAAATNVRVNGNVGMGDDFDATNWKLKVVKHPGDTLLLTMDDIKALPKTDLVFDFKCIEGWSQVSHWGGVMFSEFAKKYGLSEQTALKYVGLVTPDEEYYVGIDMASMLHPQTLLCYEMNGKPLPMNQGFPLRLIIPVKYGIKSLKRISTMSFSNERPGDYWYERGYDYFSGL